MISGVGEGTLYCADGAEYKTTILFDNGENGLNGEKFGIMDIRYVHQDDIQAGSIRGVFNEFGSNVDDQYKLRTEYNSNICNNSRLLYLGDLSGECGEDMTINLNGGHYLSGTFQGSVTCNLLNNSEAPMSETQENSDKDNHEEYFSMSIILSNIVGTY